MVQTNIKITSENNRTQVLS